MGTVKGADVFPRLCVPLVLVWAGVASAGAPAPAPTAAGPHRPEHQIAELGDFRFENGGVVRDFKVSYVTHGTLNRKKDNVILAMQHFAGDHHDVDFLIGPGKALDTDKYFVVATDFLGNARLRQDVTTGATNSGLKMEFPRYTIRDSVNVEHRLLKEYLGFEHILAATGASMGAMKAYQLAVSHPGFVRGVVPIAGSPVTNSQTRWLLRNMMDTIALDPGWYGGKYEANPTMGVTTALMNIVPWWHTHRWFSTHVKTTEQYRRSEKMWHDLFVRRFPQDARDIYYQLLAWAEFNVGDTPGFKGDARAALRSMKARVLLVGARGDMLVRRDEVIFAKDAIPNADYVELDSPFGHLICCGFDPEAAKIMNREMAEFLSKLP